jgi:hypothetical protein
MWITDKSEWIYYAFVGLLGCIVGSAQAIVGALGPRERSFAAHAAMQCGALTLSCIILLSLTSGWYQSVVAAGFLLTLFACIERWNLTRARIRLAESSSDSPPNPIDLSRVQHPAPDDYGREPEHDCAGVMIAPALTEAGVSLIDERL